MEVNAQLGECVTVINISSRFGFSDNHVAIDPSSGKYVGAKLT
jgi:hypothetical protein